MIDNNIKIEKMESKKYPSLPKNIYQIQLLDVNSEQKPTYDTRLKAEPEQVKETVLNFQFTLLNGTDASQEKEEDKNLRGRNVWQNFVPTYLYEGGKGKNKLYKIVEALIGRELTEEEIAFGIDGEFINRLIGKQCRLGIEPVTKGEKTYDSIESYYAIENELAPLTDEEKENARVKDKEEKKAEVASEEIDEIPME
jgi:hypothetical protein